MSSATLEKLSIASPHEDRAIDAPLSATAQFEVKGYREFIAKYGILDSNHPVSQFVEERINKLTPDISSDDKPRIVVLGSIGCGINAFAFSNGVIAITPEFFKFFKYTEELDAVLLHESRHVVGEHSKKLKEADSIAVVVGELRLFEYESDTSAYINQADPRCDSNPRGAISLFERLRDLSKERFRGHEGWDIAHGRLTERISVLRGVSQQFELGSSGNPLQDQIQRELTPFPEQLSALCIKLGASKFAPLNTPGQYGAPSFNTWRNELQKVILGAKTLSQREVLVDFFRRYHDFGIEHGVEARLSKEVNSLPSRKGIFNSLSDLRSLALERWFKKLDQNLKTKDIASPREVKLAHIIDTLYRFKIDLLSESKNTTTFEAELRAIAFGNEGPRLTLSKDDLPSLLKITDQIEANYETHAKNLQVLTENLLTHGVFDRNVNSGIAPKRLCRWLQNCANQISSRLPTFAKDQELSERADVIFVQKALVKAFSLNSDLDGDAEQFKAGWSEAIKGLVESGSVGAKAVANLLYLSKEEDKEFLRDVISQALGLDSIGAALSQIDKNLKRFQDGIGILSPDDLTNAARAVVSGISNLPLICLPTTQENLGTFNFLTAAKKGGVLVSAPDREACVQAVVSNLLQIRITGEKQEILSNLIVGVLQVGADSQSDYRFSAISAINDGKLNTTSWDVIPKLGKPSPFIPEGKLAFISSLKEPDGIREETALSALDILQDKIEEDPSREHYAKCIREYLAIWRPPHVVNLNREEIASNERYGAIPLSIIFRQGLSFFNEKPTSREDLTLLYDIGYFAPDSGIRRQVQTTLLPDILEGLSAVEKVNFVMDRFPQQVRYGVTFNTLNNIDRTLRTSGEFEYVEDRTVDFWRSTSEIGAKTGAVVFGDFVANMLGNTDKTEFLRAILSTARSDDRLKEILLRGWMISDIRSLRNFSLQLISCDSASEAQDIVKKFLGKEDVESANSTRDLINPVMWLQQFYALGPLERMLLLRDSLVGTGGILEKKNGREELTNIIFDEFIEKDQDPELAEQLKKVVRVFLESASNDELGELIVGAMAERVLCPPRDISDWDGPIHSTLFDFPRLWDTSDFGQLIDPHRDLGESEGQARLRVEMIDFLLPYFREIISGNPLQDSDSIRVKLDSLGLLASSETENGVLDVLNFITEVGSRLDAPGVRALQLAGQLISDLDPRIQASFMGLYDARKGQSALSARKTIGKVSPQFLGQIDTFGPVIGGGSIYTVFMAQVLGLGEEAVRVMNPNALAHVDERLTLLNTTVDGLIDEDPSYASVKPILTLVEQWIKTEMRDREFADLDPIFRKSWNNWAPDWAKKRGLSIFVPESRPTPSDTSDVVIKVVRDQFVPGVTNFTAAEQLDPLKRKEMAALGAQFYMNQIIGKNPLAESVVLSDISKGNAGVSSDRSQLVIFDRGMYLRFSFAEKLLMNQLVSANGRDSVVKAVSNLLASFPENKALPGAPIADRIVTFLDKNRDNKDQEGLVFKGLSELFCQGVHIPLKWSLLFKNINAHRQIVTEAGFSSLAEALQYKGEN